MKKTIEHDLSMALAKKVTEKAFEAYALRFAKYHPTAKWTSKNVAHIGFEAKGVKLEGDLTLKKDAIELEMHVPLVFKPLRSKAMALIEEEINQWIAKAKEGEFNA